MFLTTGLHTAGHAYFGWRFERGLRAFDEGDYERAVALLAVVEKPEMTTSTPRVTPYAHCGRVAKESNIF